MMLRRRASIARLLQAGAPALAVIIAIGIGIAGAANPPVGLPYDYIPTVLPSLTVVGLVVAGLLLAGQSFSWWSATAVIAGWTASTTAYLAGSSIVGTLRGFPESEWLWLEVIALLAYPVVFVVLGFVVTIWGWREPRYDGFRRATQAALLTAALTVAVAWLVALD